MNKKPTYEELENKILKLEQKVSMFKHIENLSRVGYWEYDVESETITWSDGVYSIYGVDPETYDPSNVPKDISFYGPEDQPKIEEAFKRAITIGESYDLELRFKNLQGNNLWVRTIGKAEIRSGAIVRVYGHIMDISSSKSIELELLKSEQHYRTVVEDQTEIISRFEPDGTLIFVNETYCRFFGKGVDELIGNRWHPVAYKDDLPMIEQKLKKLSSENPVTIVENRVMDSSGNLRWMQFVNRGFFDEPGRLIEIQSVGRDITALKDKERQLIEKDKKIKKQTKDLEKINTALEVLLDKRSKELNDLKDNIYLNFNKLIVPDLNRLKTKLKTDPNKKIVSLIINNFKNILSPATDKLTSKGYNLTKMELKIASMIRNDMTSNEIAELLNISPNTVSFHRKNLRKKLGIDQSDINIAQFIREHLNSSGING